MIRADVRAERGLQRGSATIPRIVDVEPLPDATGSLLGSVAPDAPKKAPLRPGPWCLGADLLVCKQASEVPLIGGTAGPVCVAALNAVCLLVGLSLVGVLLALGVAAVLGVGR